MASKPFQDMRRNERSDGFRVVDHAIGGQHRCVQELAGERTGHVLPDLKVNKVQTNIE